MTVCLYQKRDGGKTIIETAWKVEECKCMDSIVQINGDCDKEVKYRVEAGWNWWRK